MAVEGRARIVEDVERGLRLKEGWMRAFVILTLIFGLAPTVEPGME